MYSVTIAITKDDSVKEEAMSMKVEDKFMPSFRNVVWAYSFGEPIYGELDNDGIIRTKEEVKKYRKKERKNLKDIKI